MKAAYTIILLILSNAFMTFAWYGHLKLKTIKGFESKPLLFIILLSWGIAFFEYCFQVPANRFKWNHLVSFAFIILAVFFAFKK